MRLGMLIVITALACGKGGKKDEAPGQEAPAPEQHGKAPVPNAQSAIQATIDATVPRDGAATVELELGGTLTIDDYPTALEGKVTAQVCPPE